MSETIDKLRQKADDDDARVEAGEIHDVMQLEIVHHEQIARLQFDLLLAHAEARRAVERQEQFEPLVPRRAPRMPTRGIAEELDEQRKFLVQPHVIAPARVQLRRDVVRLEGQPASRFLQDCEDGAGGGFL